MVIPQPLDRPLEGPGSVERLAATRRRLRAASAGAEGGGRGRWVRRLRGVGVRLLALYWAVCLWVIAAGVNRAYSDLWPQVQRALPGPAADRPFPSCAAARAAGVSDIPFWSPAYTPEQDGDDDGWACEPPRGLYGR